MKKRLYLVIIAILFPCICFAQWHEITTNNGSTTASGGINNSNSSVTVSKDDIWPGSNKSSTNRNDSNERDHDRNTGGSEPLYGDSDGSSSDGSWGENDTYSNELYQTLKYSQSFGKYDELDAKKEAISSFKTMDKLLAEDCIDYLQLENAVYDYNSLSDYQKRFLGNKGKIACEKLLSKLDKGKPFYDKYSLMAQDIKNNSFSSLDPEIMRLPYESLDGYLKLFISMEDYEKAKAEYGKYEKNRNVKRVLDKARRYEMQKKHKAREANNHLILQKIRKKKNHYNPSNSTSVNGTAISREWEEASTEVMGKTMEKFFEPLKEYTYNLGSGFKSLTKRLVNFSETYSSNVFDLWDADKKAMQALARGENPEPYIIKGQHKVIDNTYRGTINSF